MGLFLTVEGPDGAGKTTQIELLRDYLSDKGYDIIVCREPGGTPISEAVRNVILNKEFTEMGHMTELLLYAAARAQLIEEVIRPALEDGKIVIDTHGFSVIDKTQYSAYTPALLNYIKDKQIDQIYLCGLDTDCCVLITAIDLFEHGYDIYVLQDFCASSGGETMHQAGLMIGRRNIGKNRVV